MRVIKRILLWLLLVVVLVGAIVGGTLAYFYVNTDAADFTPPTVAINGTALEVSDGTWYAPVMNGALYKPCTVGASAPSNLQDPITTAQVPIRLPGDALVNVTVHDAGGRTVIDSNDPSLSALTLTANGDYTCTVTVTTPQRTGKGYGTFTYTTGFTLAVEPQVEFSATRLEQGGVVCVRVSGILDESAQPEIDTDLSLTCFAPTDDGWVAFIGLHYNREPGDYPVTVRCGALEVTQTVTVVHRDFEKQYLTIDDDTVAQTATAEANAEWRNTIWPLYETADAQLYWSGQFVRPVESDVVNTPYGVFRYTNGSSYAERHAGIDWDGETGDAVYAAGRGRVVYAGYLLLTGNTVVIEHGAGLKTYYFHMDSLNCATGDMVEKGQHIGAVGSTGYSTGPHLHFEARIGNQSIDPVALTKGTSGLYFARS